MRALRAAAFVALVVLCLTTATAATRPFSASSVSLLKNSWCQDTACPQYQVLQDLGNNVELRRYPATTWAATDVQEGNLDKATAVGFQRLFKYISGDNQLEQRIDMTAPVVTTARVAGDRAVSDNYTVSFWLNTQGTRPPGPRDERVTIQDLGQLDAYVLSFGSYALGFRVKRLAFDMMDHLEQSLGVRDFDRSKFLVGVYDPPYKIWDRHNEIWLLRTGRKPGTTDFAGITDITKP